MPMVQPNDSAVHALEPDLDLTREASTLREKLSNVNQSIDELQAQLNAKRQISIELRRRLAAITAELQ